MYVSIATRMGETLYGVPGPSASTVRRARQAHELAAVFEPEVNVAILERTLADELRDEVAHGLPEILRVPMLLTVGPTAQSCRALREQLRGAPSLANDIGTAVELLADLTDASLVGVRLARVERAMCPRLHVDRVTLRSVITYVGAGTQYVDGRLFDRALLAANGPRGAHAESRAEPGPVEQAAAGDMVILKGEGWPGNTGRGAVHRSPPASHEAPRLVLTLDAL